MSYEPSWVYEGGFQFKKHYFGPKPGELAEKTPTGKLTEEFQCAQFIDGLPEVKFWIRNLVRKTTSFRLQTSKDWFYPTSCVSLWMGECSRSNTRVNTFGLMRKKNARSVRSGRQGVRDAACSLCRRRGILPQLNKQSGISKCL